MDKQIVSTFMEVTSCESQADAVHHLGSCHWNLDEAINLYFSNDAGAGGSAEPPSGSSADPILPEENVPMPTKEYSYSYHDGDAIYDDYGDDDVRAPLYYGDRSTAFDAPFMVKVPSPSLSEIVPTGWPGEEAETDGAGEAAGLENVVDGSQQDAHHDDDAEQNDDNNNTKEDDCGSMHGSVEYGAYNHDDEDYNDDNMMSYSEDDDDAYYASLAEDTDGARPAAVPPPPPQEEEEESLRELFRPPHELMYRGRFHGAKVHAARSDRFLLVNLQQASGDLPSRMQNRDLWADEAVKKAVEDGFVFFWLRRSSGNLSEHFDECKKVAGLYKLEVDQLPAVLVVDPITGQLLATRSGALVPDEFLQLVDEYAKSNPSALSLPKFVEKTPPVMLPWEQELAWAPAVKLEPPALSETPASPADDEVGGEQEQGISENSAAAGGDCSDEQEPVPENSAAAGGDCSDEQEPVPENSAAAGGDCSDEQEPVPENSAAARGDCSEQERVPVPDGTNDDELPAEMVDVDDDEPMEGEEMYKLRIRFPDGTMVAKEFGCKRKLASLFAFCRSALHGGGQRAEEEEKKAIRIVRFAGRALVAIQDDDAGATFEDLGLNYAAVTVVFDA